MIMAIRYRQSAAKKFRELKKYINIISEKIERKIDESVIEEITNKDRF